ncbi:hypothetical protein FDG2_5107 [Candidatus Protofrankia californiensis]|uniref:Uncharacterized protein n=1 Tax=Candidatus Protofrankia californiensis TaxID=1839754 RepID=A0A1C3PAW4_9ACTN|nr:hypothetical protein FDG2_5107 [Candidatus Protofrankia californiensis]
MEFAARAALGDVRGSPAPDVITDGPAGSVHADHGPYQGTPGGPPGGDHWTREAHRPLCRAVAPSFSPQRVTVRMLSGRSEPVAGPGHGNQGCGARCAASPAGGLQAGPRSQESPWTAPSTPPRARSQRVRRRGTRVTAFRDQASGGHGTLDDCAFGDGDILDVVEYPGRSSTMCALARLAPPRKVSKRGRPDTVPTNVGYRYPAGAAHRADLPRRPESHSDVAHRGFGQ